MIDIRDPFFVVGYPRSGTTLLASMLTGFEEIFIPAETHFFRLYLKQTRPLIDIGQEINRFCSYHRITDLHLSADDFNPYLGAIAKDRKLLLKYALHILATKSGATLYGEKTPGHALNMNEIIKSYPKAKFIFILRDGRDCVLSNIKERWTRNNPYRHAAEWSLFSYRARILKKKKPHSIFFIRYEELIENPGSITNDIFRFLDIDRNSLTPSKKTKASLIPEWEMAWKSNALSEPNLKSRYKWKSHGDKHLLHSISFLMEHELKIHGYQAYAGRLSLGDFIRTFLYLPQIYPRLRGLSEIFQKIKMVVKI